MDSTEGMRVFTRVVRAGSLSAAGRAMGLSSASVSRKIAALEESVGARLLNRTSRRLALTQVGEMYFEKARAILDEIDTLANAVSAYQGKPSGLLAVHTRLSIASEFLTDALPHFLKLYPDINLRLWLTEEPRDVLDDRIDVSIRIGQPAEPDLVIRRLSSGTARVLFASESYLAAHPPIRHPRDLLEHNCLSIPQEGVLEVGQSSWFWRDEAGIHELRVSGSLQVNDVPTIRRAALEGVGMALLPVWLIADQLKSGEIRPLLPEYEMTPTGFDPAIYAVFPKTPYMAPKVRVFLDFLVDTFGRREAELKRMAKAAQTLSGPTLGGGEG
ncbi:MAG TPA: LysR family transcriptional regulator [Alphaproteobacteria bacterium]|nr:LysR family transcriptional regulator [Alphaproteobacteria bacterium]